MKTVFIFLIIFMMVTVIHAEEPRQIITDEEILDHLGIEETAGSSLWEPPAGTLIVYMGDGIMHPIEGFSLYDLKPGQLLIYDGGNSVKVYDGKVCP